MFGGTYGGGLGREFPVGSSLAAHLMGGGFNRFGAHPSAYDDYLTAYSMAMLPGQERDNVSYGGKVILPPSSLDQLTRMEVEGPWVFRLRNPNPNVPSKDALPAREDGGASSSAASSRARESHAGVLEFIADHGRVHLPAWMMKSLALNEGDRVRVTGTTLPKGKMVKIQPQTVDFLEISDPKAVLEQALRNFSTLTPGDIIEFKYNCLTFEVLIMEITPDAPGISIIDTDLEVDFAAPKGYVEPAPQPKIPPATMASKLKIETSATESIPASGASTPGGGSGAGGHSSRRESSSAATVQQPAGPFRGAGQTLSGKKSKGKKTKEIEQIDPFSLVRRTDQPKIVTNDTLLEDKKVPAALRLEFGRLFFGYDYIPPGGKQEDKENTSAKQISFSGTGQTLSGRAPRRKVDSSAPKASVVVSSSAPGTAATGAAGELSAPAVKPFGGQGETLGGKRTVKRPLDNETSSGRRQKSPNVIEVDSSSED
ncbi:UFD1-domain-containing protein [Tilletiaria anomala UBC 951]|uniref:UFD1-domain-containing protein n=1 Tax=Tilletiaria anomala (strain ATCC 24038 / CBS 436.72 / UBC 951) TaxID=1037660 RepID=A0A066WGW4_TILAU|nr:UFD1-domain-containing protein [Tilletiaria anomala UBC 951]KDN53051.1 UFD1-domain-containing protein [Tilletiaria anomala UBC 951]